MKNAMKCMTVAVVILLVIVGCGESSKSDGSKKISHENIDFGDIGTFDVNEGMGGFASGGYDEDSIYSTQAGWTRQSRFKGVQDPEIKQEISLPGRLKSFETEPLIDGEGYIYLKINEYDDEPHSDEGEYDGFYKYDRAGEIIWKKTGYHEEYDIIVGNSENRAPAFDNHNQLIGTIDEKTLAAIDRDTGEFNFVYQIEDNRGAQPWSPTIGSDGTIYFVYVDRVVALNSDGSEKWKYEYEGEDAGPDFIPAIAEDRLFVRAGYDLMALDLDGNFLWRENIGYSPTPAMSNILIAENGNLYLANDDRLVSYSPDGELLWDVQVDEDTSFMSGSTGLALTADGLIIGLFSPDLYAFDLEGNEVWRTENLQTYGGITVDSEGTSYFAGGRTLYSVDKSGILNWEFELPSSEVGDPVIGPNEE
ncbi:MAG: PQQ-binding-like beta-propeller repeat protein, partial [Clostridiaceae bacterium]|nr:PQQ-binding-like beta-propeller repeat protein [Clostridiaceae bacterium]